MYIHLGRDYVLNDRDIIGIFNLETTTVSPRGREFLNYAQKNGAVVSLSDDLPQCYVLADAPVDTVYLSELSSAAMKRRTEMSSTVILLRSSPLTSNTMRPPSIIRVRLPSSRA